MTDPTSPAAEAGVGVDSVDDVVDSIQAIESLPVDQRSSAYLARYQQLLDRLDAAP